MIVVFGVYDLFKKGRLQERDRCEFCKKRALLASYTAWKFFHVYFIPLLPLGHGRTVRYCPLCRKHRKVKMREVRARIEGAPQAARSALAAGDVNAALQAIMTCAQMGGLEQAEALFDLMDQSDVRVLRALGRFQYMRKRTAPAEDIYRKAIELAGEDAASHYLLGELLLGDRKRAEEALAELELAATLEPRALDVRQLLSEEYQKRKMWRKLLAVLEEMAPLDPEAAAGKAFQKRLKKARKKAGKEAAAAPAESVNPYAAP